jgi:hypothetical protein
MRTNMVWLAIAALLLAGCSKDSATGPTKDAPIIREYVSDDARTGSQAVVVQDAATRKPVAGAMVQSGPYRSDPTNGRGETFVYIDLDVDETLRAEADKYLSKEMPAQLSGAPLVVLLEHAS